MINATATDEAGRTGTSSTISVTVDREDPTATIVDPLDGGFETGDFIINGTSSDVTTSVIGVNVTINGATSAATTFNSHLTVPTISETLIKVVSVIITTESHESVRRAIRSTIN